MLVIELPLSSEPLASHHISHSLSSCSGPEMSLKGRRNWDTKIQEQVLTPKSKTDIHPPLLPARCNSSDNVQQLLDEVKVLFPCNIGTQELSRHAECWSIHIEVGLSPYFRDHSRSRRQYDGA